VVTEWRLQPTDKPAWFGRWWSDPEGAVLVVPQGLFLPEDGMHLQRGGWWRLLGLILRLRSKRPLDGVIWTVPVSRLGNLEQATQLGLAARRRFIDLLQRFGLSVPVYVIVTGLEELPGVQDLISALPDEARGRYPDAPVGHADYQQVQVGAGDRGVGRGYQVLLQCCTSIRSRARRSSGRDRCLRDERVCILDQCNEPFFTISWITRGASSADGTRCAGLASRR